MQWFWKQAETIQFEYILKDLFESYQGFKDAVQQWTSGQWRGRMAEKIAAREFPEEIEQAVWKDFAPFMEWCSKESLRIKEKEKTPDAAQNPAGSRAPDDENAEEKQADLARERKKLKSVPVTQRLIMRYEWARNAVKVKGTRENYIFLIEICQLVLENWEMFGCLEEFSGVLEKYEETVLDFFASAHTLESLLYVMVFYCDKTVLDNVDKDTRKKYLKTGLEYAKLYWDNMDNEDGAYKYLCYYCRLAEEYGEGEDIFERSIRNKIWKQGEECALKYQSDKIIDVLALNIGRLAEHFRRHGQDGEALKCEKELEALRSRVQ